MQIGRNSDNFRLDQGLDVREAIEIELKGGDKLEPIEAEVLDLVLYPDRGLTKKCAVVSPDEIEGLNEDISKMIFTMYHAQGIGLAANQVGIDKSIIVYDIEWPTTKAFRPTVMFNPILANGEGASVIREGCLSVGAGRAPVERFEVITVDYMDIHGKTRSGEFRGLEAHCIQHEIDHVEGKLFLDRISKLRKDLIVKRMKKIKRQAKRIAESKGMQERLRELAEEGS